MKRVDDMKTDVRRLEKHIKKLSDRIKRIEDSMDSIKSRFESNIETDRVLREDLSSSKASFRIDLYPRQGHYQGKIEHLGSTEGIPPKSTFKDLDAKVIMNFIAQHLLRKAPSGETTPGDVEVSQGVETLPTEAAVPESAVSSVQALPIIRLEPIDRPARKSIQRIATGQAFGIQVLLPPAHISPSEPAKKYVFSVYVQSLETRSSSLLGEALVSAAADKESLATIQCSGLPKGMHRLWGKAMAPERGPGVLSCFEWSRDYLDVY